MTSKLSGASLAFSICVLLASQFTGAPNAQAEVVDRILAIVNDDIITQSDVVDFERRLKNGGLVDDQLVPDEATKQALLKDSAKLLQKVIDSRIIDSEVKKQGLSVPFERVEQEIRNIARRNNMSRDDLKNALQEKGIVFSVYQDFIKTGLERQALVEKSVTSKIKISEDDVLAALISEGKASETQAFEYTIAHILFLNKKAGAEAAAAKAQQAHKKLKEGAAFDRVAADYSNDPDFEIGGLLGTFKSGELSKELETTVAKLSPGEWTLPLPTTGGLHIVRLVKRKLIPDPKLEKEKDRVRALLGEKLFRRQYDIWLEQLRSESFLRLNK
ncbi:MAG: peptidylprolyl isomerase [Bdellovibrionales bacterium]|nr:peptidylprolyl isomerase [Bdellovibrionales bacterium]